jgi:tetratricopeptide (TPR) repeat protein
MMHRGVAYNDMQQYEQAFRDLQSALATIRELLPKRAFLIGTYAQSIFYALSVLQASESKEGAMTLMQEAEDIFSKYELTEEAQFWQDKLFNC